MNEVECLNKFSISRKGFFQSLLNFKNKLKVYFISFQIIYFLKHFVTNGLN